MKRWHRCKGTGIRKVRDRFVDKFPLADGRVLEFVFEDFPQKVCSPCGERYYEAKDLIAAEDAVTRELMARGIRDSAVFKYLRKALGLKATELADLLGVTAETISRWENGHNEADLAVWAALHFLVDDHRSGLTTTLDRLRRLVEARIPKRPVPLTLARAHGATLEALADVDSGHVIDHQAVQAWADSLGTRKPRPPPRR
jgi:transcriptional regulator with XRE-family HTH domain